MSTISSIPCFSCCGINSMCCGNRNTWPEKLYATFIAKDCPCIDGLSVEMSFHESIPGDSFQFKGYFTNYPTALLRPEQFTTCTGVMISPFKPIMNGCDLGALAIRVTLFCSTGNNLSINAELSNYEQTVEPNPCDPLMPGSGYVGGGFAFVGSGSTSSSSNSGSYFFDDGPYLIEFIWNCSGPVIFRYNNVPSPSLFSNNLGLGTQVRIDDCSSNRIDILVTE